VSGTRRRPARTACRSRPRTPSKTRVVVDAELNDDNTWQSTEIQFPNLSLAGLESVDPVVTVPGGLSGEFSEADDV
jgi:hypothetical protein